MSTTARIQTIVSRCRAANVPQPLAAAIWRRLCADSSEDGSADVGTEGDDGRVLAGAAESRVHPRAFVVLSNPAAARLDELDLRILDVCIATGTLWYFLQSIAARGPLAQACDYCLEHGVDASGLVRDLLQAGEWSAGARPTALGEALLGFVPDHFDAMLRAARGGDHLGLVQLLLMADPPDLERAWAAARAAPEHALGACAAALLSADAQRFSGWAREVAGPGSRATRASRAAALRALAAAQAGTAQWLDAAVDAARTPAAARDDIALNIAGLECAAAGGESLQVALLGEAALGASAALAHYAVDGLAALGNAEARAALRRCASQVDGAAGASAARALLSLEWTERPEYALTLLGHRGPQVQALAVQRVAEGGRSMLAALEPLLCGPDAGARLNAARACARIGGPRAQGLLRLQLERETEADVLEVLRRSTGVQATRDAIDEIVAEAEATIRPEATRPFAWFDLAGAPAPYWIDGTPLAPVVTRYLFHRQAGARRGTLEDGARSIVLLLDRAASIDFAYALVEGFRRAGNRRQAWCLPIAEALGEERPLANGERRARSAPKGETQQGSLI